MDHGNAVGGRDDLNLLDDIVIIGAGLAGTALALSFLTTPKSSNVNESENGIQRQQNKQQHSNHQPNIRIYESRSPSAPELASGVVLTPNGMEVLDALGVFERVKDLCWVSTHRTYKNEKDETTKKIPVSDDELGGGYGGNHRVWRSVLLHTMRSMLEERGVVVNFGCKFEGIVSDDHLDERDDSLTREGGSGKRKVKFIINGEEETASLLVGADGIYSSVRRFLDPDMKPEYTGVTGVIGHINRSTVDWPYEDYEKNCTIQDKPGAIFFIPEVKDGSEIMIGLQAQIPDRSRAEWDEMQRDKDKLCEFYAKDYHLWGKTARSIIDSVCRAKDMLYAWPFLRMPKLERWYSSTGRVVIVGDAAHALPPSSAQGVNQALEDVWSLTLLLHSGRDATQALRFWQDMRQKRIDAVFDWATNATNVQRLPQAEREKILADDKLQVTVVKRDADDMKWLYQPRSREEIHAWITVTDSHAVISVT